MIKVDIFSDNEYLVKFDNESYELSLNNFISLKTYDSCCFKLECYPINNDKTCLPFVLKIFERDNHLICFNQNAKIYKFADYYEIHISDIYINQLSNAYIQTVEINKQKIMLNFDCSKITISTDDMVKIINIQTRTCEVKTIENSLYIICEANNTKSIIVFCPKSQFVTQLNYEQLEQNEKQLKILEVCNNSIGTQRLTIINFSSDEIEILHEYYSTGAKIFNKSEKAIPYMFFDAIKSGNIPFAQNLLHDNIKSQLPPNSFETFFGKFNKIHIKNLLPYTINLYYDDHAKTFQVELSENKIKDIIEI